MTVVGPQLLFLNNYSSSQQVNKTLMMYLCGKVAVSAIHFEYVTVVCKTPIQGWHLNCYILLISILEHVKPVWYSKRSSVHKIKYIVHKTKTDN